MSPSPLVSFLKKPLLGYMDFKAGLRCTSFLPSGSSWTQARDLDYFLAFHGLASIEHIDEGQIHRWVHAIPGHSPNTKNLKIRFARGFFRYLIRLGLAKHNPALRIPYLKARRYKPHIFTLREIHDLLLAADADKRRRPNAMLGWTLQTMILLYYACGLRLTEALNITIKDVDFQHRTLSLWNTKFRKERLLPISAPIARCLKDYLDLRLARHPTADPAAPFFRLTFAKRPHRSVIEHHFRRLLVACRLAKPRGRAPHLHDLRHTFAVHRLYKWYQEGHHPLNKLPLLATYMGHLNFHSTQVYLAITNTLLREGDRRFQAAFEDVAERSHRRACRRP